MTGQEVSKRGNTGRVIKGQYGMEWGGIELCNNPHERLGTEGKVWYGMVWSVNKSDTGFCLKMSLCSYAIST